MIGMGVVETNDVLTTLPSLALNTDQFARINVIAVLRRVRPRVAAGYGGRHHPPVVFKPAQQDAAALVRIGFLAVPPDRLPLRFSDLQHKGFTTEARREKTPGSLLRASVTPRELNPLPRSARSNTCRPSRGRWSRSPPRDRAESCAPPSNIQPPPRQRRSPTANLLRGPGAWPLHRSPRSRFQDPGPRRWDRKSSARSRFPCASRPQSRETPNPAAARCNESPDSTLSNDARCR